MDKNISKKVFEALLFVWDLADKELTNDQVWEEFYNMQFADWGESLNRDDFAEYVKSLVTAQFVVEVHRPFVNMYAPTKEGIDRLAVVNKAS